MNYASYSDELRRRKLDNPVTRCLTTIVVLTLHLLIIGGIVFWGGGCRSTREPKEKIYKVKLGGAEPSHAPEVGPPERLRPTGDPSPPSPPAPPEPQVKPQPKPAPKEPSVKPAPRPAPKEPTVKPQPKNRPKNKPKNKPKPKPTSRQQSNNVREPAVKPSSTRQNPRNGKPSKSRSNKDDGIYHPPGGNNFNSAYKIGSRDAGQVKGPADNRTPMAGKDDEAEKEWGDRVGKFLHMFWSPPENVFWGDNPPSADLELVIDSDGRVLGARLVKSSGNARMDGTIQQLIRQLNGKTVPRPPRGREKIVVELSPKK